MKHLFVVLSLLSVAILSGCAGGKNYNYSNTPIDVETHGDNIKISVGVHDQRKYIVTGEKYPQYVGIQRSVSYVPWNVNTQSGRPMADDFLLSITSSLKSKGYKVTSVSLSEKNDRDEVLAQLRKNQDDRLLLFTIDEWYFDVFYKVRMSCSMKLEVFNNDGALLAFAEDKKEIWEDDQNAIPDVEFKATVENLLTNEDIVMALNPKINLEALVKKETKQPIVIQETLAEEITKCTTDQILTMKNIGMTDDQIRSACQ